MDAQKMVRGSETMNKHLTDMKKISVRQTRKGWFLELLGCEVKSEFKYFSEGTDQIATSLEDSNCLLRNFCLGCYPYTVEVKEIETEEEILSMERPCSLPVGGCKCCSYQSLNFTSGGQALGKVEEQCWYCVPVFKIFNENDDPIYKIHQPTCCGGGCVNCCYEGNPFCGRGCCKVPFLVFPSSQEETDGDAPSVGKILKVPKSILTEMFTDAEAFDISFPEDATNSQKAMLTGTAIFLNSIFFEGQDKGQS